MALRGATAPAQRPHGLAEPLLGPTDATAAALPPQLQRELWPLRFFCGIEHGAGWRRYRCFIRALLVFLFVVEIGNLRLARAAYKTLLPTNSAVEEMLMFGYLTSDLIVVPFMCIGNWWMWKHARPGAQTPTVRSVATCAQSRTGLRRLLHVARGLNVAAAFMLGVILLCIVVGLGSTPTLRQYFADARVDGMSEFNSEVVRLWILMEIVGQPLQTGQAWALVLLFSLTVRAHETRVGVWCREVSAGKEYEAALREYARIRDDVEALASAWQAPLLVGFSYVIWGALLSVAAACLIPVGQTSLMFTFPAIGIELLFIWALARGVAKLNSGTARCTAAIAAARGGGLPGELETMMALEVEAMPCEFLIYGLRVSEQTVAKGTVAVLSFAAASALTLGYGGTSSG